MEKEHLIIPPTIRAESGQLLLHLADDVMDKVNDVLKPYNISESKLGLLLLFVSGEPERKSLQPSEIADRLGIKRASVTKQLNWLEEHNFISRATRTEDQRMINVDITQKGYQLLAAVMPEYWRTCAEMTNPLTEEETVLLISLLERIKRSI